MVVGSGRGNVVSSFFREDLSEVGVFRRERDFGFCLFSGDSKFRCHSKLGDERGVWKEAFAIASEDPVDLAIVQRVLEVLILRVVVQVVVETRVVDGVYVYVAVGAGKGFSEERVVSLSVGGVGGVKIL